MSLAVYFDVDGTLLEKIEDADEVLAVAERFGVELSGADVREFNDLVQQFFRRNRPDGYLEAVRTMCADRGWDVDPSEFTEALHRRKVENTRPVDGAAETLAALREAATLGVLTNGTAAVQRRKLERHGLDGFFEAVVVSGEEETMKPKDAMFELGRERLDGDAYVYVADRLADDIVPAQDHGYVGVLVASAGSPVATLTVRSIADLTVEDLRAAVDAVDEPDARRSDVVRDGDRPAGDGTE